MQTAVQRCRRLMNALEELAAQEATTLRGGDFSAVAEIQDRAAVLIDDLVTHAEAMDDDLRQRLKALREVRAHSSEWLASELAQTRDTLDETGVAQRRVARFAPVYGGQTVGAKARPQLNFVG